MLDLGSSFVASVARDPDVTALVDGDLRLSYRQWYARISALVVSFDAIGLKPGDHLVFETSGASANVRPVRAKSPFAPYRGIGNGRAISGRKAIVRTLRELRGQ